jgi:drug/metabolite transporter (DMT)-like permease
MTPAFSLALGHVLLPDEKVTWTKALALALGLGSVALNESMNVRTLVGAVGILGSVAFILDVRSNPGPPMREGLQI